MLHFKANRIVSHFDVFDTFNKACCTSKLKAQLNTAVIVSDFIHYAYLFLQSLSCCYIFSLLPVSMSLVMLSSHALVLVYTMPTLKAFFNLTSRESSSSTEVWTFKSHSHSLAAFDACRLWESRRTQILRSSLGLWRFVNAFELSSARLSLPDITTPGIFQCINSDGWTACCQCRYMYIMAVNKAKSKARLQLRSLCSLHLHYNKL
jgi:hypothetical protein